MAPPVVIWTLAVLLVVVGLVGVVLPAVPGTVLIFAGLLLAAWADGFARVGVFTITVLGILTVATYFVDVAMMALGMKRLGTTRRAAAGAAIGALAGLFFGLPGLIIGPFAGAVVGELTSAARLAARRPRRGCGLDRLRHRNHREDRPRVRDGRHFPDGVVPVSALS